jgi:hypothetical protein
VRGQLGSRRRIQTSAVIAPKHIDDDRLKRGARMRP